MKLFEANFVIAAHNPREFPPETIPEIAFAGRSNVGKSSFINMIVLRNNLAKTSQNPGKTQSINFFNVENQFMLVDLPGFGYAKASKSDRESWQKLIYDYILNRKNLKFTTVLIDCRIEPIKLDLALIEWLENAQKEYLIALTKVDKISTSLLNSKISQWKFLTNQCKHLIEIIPTSSINRTGREEFLAILKRYI
ncbi:MAG TPA: ribosome biogenesis GTP-binding protein YihA/YsxC [Bacteroidota bacterium]|nr:ribosome biogenesis GTP-binding protein YihA/YsxC [Candidatus Kapabacteria bacterium]HRS02376.1 ribosome biogenesis GTP-binding protein YihA/YsxC [Bacteroidota bacterium]HRT68112.1 ribosome biogenesis GTP-binding protein YihA/YsxC [Bacteroidota bacterium]